MRENALLVGDTGVVEAVSSLKQEGISEMNATSTRSVVVEAGGTQVVGHVGLHALGAFADRLGVPMVLSDAVGWDGPGTPAHDRGRVLSHAMLMLAGGGESCADIEALASQGRLFGDVPMHLEMRLSVEDSPNSAGVALDAIRCAKSALDRGLGGVLEGPSAFFCKHPPVQHPDDEAHRLTEDFIRKVAGGRPLTAAGVTPEQLRTG